MPIKQWLLTSSFIVLIFGLCNAAEKAYMTDGRVVILNNDGTWEFSNDSITKAAEGFRGVVWGASKEEVKKSEEWEVVRDNEDAVIYKGKLAGLEVYAGYIFVKDKLVRTSYLINETHTNKTDFLTDYNTLKNLLIKKYGDPTEDETFWKNDLYKDRPQDWGLAISAGHLFKYCRWNTQSTGISLLITGDNFKITLKIEYQSTELESLEEHEADSKALEDL